MKYDLKLNPGMISFRWTEQKCDCDSVIVSRNGDQKLKKPPYDVSGHQSKTVN